MALDHFDPELDALLADIHRLLDEDPGATTSDPDLDLFELPITEADPPAAQAPVSTPQPRRVSQRTGRQPKTQEQAYADWLYEQEQPAANQQPPSWTQTQKVPRHVARLQKNQEQAYADWLYEQGETQAVPTVPEKNARRKPQPEVFEEEAPRKKKKRHGFRNFLIFLLLLACAMMSVLIFVLPNQPMNAGGTASRKEGVSTILLAGADAGGARTDTLMLFTVDRPNKTLSLVSIPRDTLVNGSYTVPKINSVYGANNGGDEGIDMLMTRVEEIIGYRPDGYIFLRLDAFVRLVDALGGVTFDVPMDMYYNDPAQDLYIDLAAGEQLLTGQQAMGLVRFRSGYADADLGRVQVQRQFLSALLKQAVSLEGIAKSPALLNLLQEHMSSDLTAANYLWLAESVLMADLRSIQTATLPGSTRSIGGGSYYVLDPASVAQTVNTYCNPYETEITAADLNIRQQ